MKFHWLREKVEEAFVNCVCNYSRTPVIRTLVIRIATYPYRLGPWGKFIGNSTKLTCLEITGFRVR